MSPATTYTVFNSQIFHTHTRNNNICTTLTAKISYVSGNVKSHRSEFLPPLSTTLKCSKVFGPAPNKKKKSKKLRKDNEEEEEEEEEEEGIIPEVVTNKKISRMGFSVGFPLDNNNDDIIKENSCWSPSLSAELYKINAWGIPYFAVNAIGNVIVRPHGSKTMSHQEIDLHKVVKKVFDPKSIGGLGLQFPLLVRFPDVLKDRLESLQYAFHCAINSHGYESHYQGVYPVKCNNDRFIVEDILEFGSRFRFGLEAGSKPELLLAMSCLCKGNREAFLVCNGFKDNEYITLALVVRKLELNSVIVLEREEELDMVVEISNKLRIRPVISVRAKLSTNHFGHFGSTSGDKGKFGLTTGQILRVVKKLEQLGMLDCLQLLHFHIGSQIPSTALLADGVGEAAQIYCELLRLGAHMQVFDIGSGLGIDYDGSKSSDSDLSVSYGLQEYAETVVHAVKYVCDRRNVKHPVICSESGRAIVSHHSVLIFEAIGSSSNGAPSLSSLGLHCLGEGVSEEALADYQNIFAATIHGEHEACLLYTHQFKKRCIEQFKQGTLGIEQHATVDGLCDLNTETIGEKNNVKKNYVNLSVFTSIPDFWSFQQLFPIVPIHRLDEKPTMRGILLDLTCDSDGKIDKFIGGDFSLPLHELGGQNGGYYLGMFLGGAYEESLGGFGVWKTCASIHSPKQVIQCKEQVKPTGIDELFV